jgi:hypothetical protein
MGEYPSLEAASTKKVAFPSALENSDIPGAGGNVYAALAMLRFLVEGNMTLEEAFAWAQDSWDHCDGQKNGNPKRWEAGTAEAEALKQGFRERFASWKPVVGDLRRRKKP